MAKRNLSNSRNLTVLLADDDEANRLLFKEAPDELTITSALTNVNRSENQNKWLKKTDIQRADIHLIDRLRKHKIASWAEINLTGRLQNLPMINFSPASSRQRKIRKIREVFMDAALDDIRKPGIFSELKKVIHRGLTPDIEKNSSLSCTKEKFVFTGNSKSQPDEITAITKERTHRETNQIR